MIPLAVNIAFVALVLAILLALVRLVRGPAVLDRILAFDLIATSVVGMIALLSVRWDTPLYLELILIFSLLGFVGTVTFVFYLHRTMPARPDPAPAGSDPNPRRP